MENVIAIGIIVVILGCAIGYLVRAKRRGVTCVGCPDSACAGHKKGGCHCTGEEDCSCTEEK